MTITLEGIRRDRWSEKTSLARALASSLARNGKVAYRVEANPGNSESNAPGRREMRASERRRSRLSSAKLLDSSGRFLCECLVHDRSSSGLRLKLMKNVSLPNRYLLYDDETNEINVVSTVWRRDSLLGVRRTAESASVKESMRAALRGRYYAVPN
jgi:hypothetical protein